MIRAFLETATRSWTFERRLTIAGRDVPIIVSPSGGLRFLFKSLDKSDPQLVSLVSRYVRPGSVVWDVGANLGLFAFPAAAIAGPQGHVVAFEPDPWLVQLLRKSAGRQQSSARVTVVPAACAAANGIRSFTLAKRSRSSNHLSEYGIPPTTGGALETFPVVAITLDWALEFFPPPDVLKIDVEGAEMEALRGAESLIAAHHPVVLCEVNETACSDVTHFLRSRGYRLIDGETGEPSERAAWSTIALYAP